jgi:hypothetical protein
MARSHRHRHETEDEFIYVLSGVQVLVEDEETPLGPGGTEQAPGPARAWALSRPRRRDGHDSGPGLQTTERRWLAEAR